MPLAVASHAVLLQDNVKLSVEGRYELTMDLPASVDVPGTRAKLSLKHKSLIVRMPVMSP